MRELLGVNEQNLQESDGDKVRFGKQDLPYAKPLDTVTLQGSKKTSFPVFAAVSRIANHGATVVGTFKDGSPALTKRKVGKGEAMFCAFLPGLTYFHPAIPKRPMDRGALDSSMTHFLPTKFDPAIAEVMQLATGDIERPVVCSNDLVESTVLQSKHGTVIPLINWTPDEIKKLQVTIHLPGKGKTVSLASGRPVKVEREGNQRILTLDLDVADAVIIK